MINNRRPLRPWLSHRLIECAISFCTTAALLFILSGCKPGQDGEAKTALVGEIGGANMNVVLISIDTLRADYIGCYGHPTIKTPNIDRLAAEGTRFAQCISSAPITLPSHSTMLTGSYQYVHGARENMSFQLGQENTTLAEIMKRAGYTTHAEVAAVVLGKVSGINQGFDHFGDLKGTAERDRNAVGDLERSAEDITRSGIAMLEDAKERPFFLFLHYFDPHQPHSPPEEFARQYADPCLAEIASVDSQIGKFIDALERLELAKNTLVIVTADHGEAMGQHDEITHSFFLYDSTQHVPLIMWNPSQIPGGQVVHSQVGLVDLAPTVVEYVKLKRTPQMQGASLIPLLKNPGVDLHLPIYADTLTAQINFEYCMLRSLRVDGWKYIHSTDPELYHVAQDPRELFNLAGTQPQKLEALRSQLHNLMANSPPPPGKRSAVRAVTKEDVRALQALGYLGGTQTDDASTSTSELDEFEPEGTSPRNKTHVITAFCRARVALRIGRFEDAARFLEGIALEEPNNPMIIKEYGDALIGLERYPEAKERYTRSLELDPENQITRAALAATEALEGEFEESEENYIKVLKEDPTAPLPHFGFANLLAEQQRFDEALEHYQIAAELSPGLREITFRWGIALYRSGRIQEAKARVSAALEEEPDRLDINLALAQIHAALGELDQAIAIYERVLENAAENAAVHRKLADLYAKNGKHEAAFTQLLRTAQLEDKIPQAWLNAGLGAVRIEEIDQATECFAKALELKPDYARARDELVSLKVAAEKPDEAIALYKRWMESFPEDGSGYLGAADLLRQKGQHAEALGCLIKGLGNLPNDPGILNDLAWRLATSPDATIRNGSEAVRFAERADELTGGKRPEVIDTLAAAYAEAARFDDAIAAVDRAINAAKEGGASQFVKQLGQRREQYAKGQAFHEK